MIDTFKTLHSLIETQHTLQKLTSHSLQSFSEDDFMPCHQLGHGATVPKATPKSIWLRSCRWRSFQQTTTRIGLDHALHISPPILLSLPNAISISCFYLNYIPLGGNSVLYTIFLRTSYRDFTPLHCFHLRSQCNLLRWVLDLCPLCPIVCRTADSHASYLHSHCVSLLY